jgi:tetratricopeptide (TPR) repeat protein
MKIQKKSIFILFAIVAAWTLSVSLKKPEKLAKPVKTNLTQEEQEKFDYYYYEAILQKEKKDFGKALEIFKQCYLIDSLDAGLLDELAVLYAGYGDTEKALPLLNRALERLPDNWWINMHLLSLYAQSSKLDEAIALAETMQTIFPYREDVYQILASFYIQTQQHKKAIAAYDKLESLSSINEELSLEKNKLYLAMKKPKKAIAEIEKLIKKFPGNQNYKVLLANTYLELREEKKAMEIFKQVMALDPELPLLYMSLADYYGETGQTKLADDAIRKALMLNELPVENKIFILGEYVENLVSDTARLDETESLFKMLTDRYPLEAQVHEYYSLFLMVRHRKSEATAELESALAINAKNSDTWTRLIVIYFEDKNYEKMVEITDKAIENIPENPIFYFYKTLATFQQENYHEALAAAKAALPLLKEDDRGLKSEFYSQLGDLYYKLNQSDSAFRAFEEALTLNPGNIMVMNNYAYYLSEENKELRKAELMSGKTIEKEPANSTYLDTYAWILYKQGNYSLAKFYIERAVDNLPKDYPAGVVMEHYGDILFKTGDTAKALDIWKKAAAQPDATNEVKQKAQDKL